MKTSRSSFEKQPSSVTVLPRTRQSLTSLTKPSWERQPKESNPAWYAFTVYRNVGPGTRSTARVARELGKSRTLIQRWCARWRWVNRCVAWDAEMDASSRAALVERRAEILRREAEVAALRQNVLHREMEKLLEASAASTDPVMTVGQMLRFLEHGARREREFRTPAQARDVPTAAPQPRRDQRHDDQLSELADELLNVLESADADR